MPKRSDISKMIFATGILLCIIAFSSSMLACTESSLPTDIGPNFQVQVVTEAKSVEGLHIELSTIPPPAKDDESEQDSRTIAVVRADANGLAVFKGVRPGLYSLEVKDPASPVSVEIRVLKHPSMTLSAVITLQWPNRKFLAAQWASGFLSGSVKTDRGPLEDLRDPVFRPVAGAKRFVDIGFS